MTDDTLDQDWDRDAGPPRLETRRFDPVLFEVLGHALIEATEEMAVTLRRSAYSTNIKTRADFSCVVFDRDVKLVACNFAQPTHLGSLVEMVPRALDEYGTNRLGDGDMLATNHPYIGGTHLNDVCLIAPVYYGDELVGYVANTAHHVDVGGGAPASLGAFREIYQEGIIIPPVKLVHAGELVQDVVQLIIGQIRSQRETSGDLRAQVAANLTGQARVKNLVDRVGLETLRDYVDEVLAHTERRTRAAMTKLPVGVYEAEGVLDNDGFTDDPVRLRVRVAVADDEIVFDFTGCDAQRAGPVNATHAQSLAACSYVLKCLVDHDIPANDGFYRVISMVAPEGTVANCTAPAPVVGGFETNARLTDLLFKAVADALPNAVPAGTKGMMCQVGFGGIDPRTGEYYCFYEALAGGYGGRHNSDGPDAVQVHGQNTENAPIEEIEVNYPVRIERYGLVENSEGPGMYRGGLGLRRDYSFPDSAPVFTILADRDRYGPHGLFGGESGAVAEYVLNPDTEDRRVSSKVTLVLNKGDVVSYRTCGGGGYGAAWERTPSGVLRDVRDGKVSAERARTAYGVVIDADTNAVDESATSAVRFAKGLR